MLIRRLHIEGLRSLTDVRLDLDPGLNVLVGSNGAGKTSVLEAVFLLSHGRSFRAGPREALIQRGEDGLQLYAEVLSHGASVHRLGLGRRGHRWDVRLDGSSQHTLADLAAHCAAICFEPGSHALIAGPAEERRRYLDWGVFHVEHAYLGHWRRYQRALRQRNVALRQQARKPDPEFFAPWDAALSHAALPMERARSAYLELLRPHLDAQLKALLPELGAARLVYRPGWDTERPFRDVLQERLLRDAARGATSAGPHRADWNVTFEGAPVREHLSRGQEKLCALACILAQGHVYALHSGAWPVVCLDDLASELDTLHQEAVVHALRSVQAQVLLTDTKVMPALEATQKAVFHVEHGRVTR